MIGIACAAVEAQQSWPGFRNDGSGIISVEQIPTKWSPEGIAWRTEVARNQLWDVEQMLTAEKFAAALRKKNAVSAEPKIGPEKLLARMPEKSLHKMFSCGDPTAYAASAVDDNLLIRTGQHLYCVRTK